MPRFILKSAFISFLLLPAGLACSGDTITNCICTEEFRTFAVTVVDEAGQPVSDAMLTRLNLRSGQVLEPTWLGLLEPGVYLVADDGHVDAFSSAGDMVRVTGTNGTISFSADFEFASPAPCRCHVEQLAGPDTVVMR